MKFRFESTKICFKKLKKKNLNISTNLFFIYKRIEVIKFPNKYKLVASDMLI